MFQDPEHLYRRAVVKQELADVRRSHRLHVKRNAYESQEEQICKTSATSSVEKHSIKSIFKRPHCLCLFASGNVEGVPRARDRIWNP